MSAPDFSRDPERVALAKVLYEAACCPNFGDALSFEEMRPSRQQYYLRMADAAITHLGSGYRLPKATEENAERLARDEWAAYWERLARDEWAAYCRTQKAEGELFAFDNQTPFVKRQAIEKALEHLGALHAAFADPEEATVAENATVPEDDLPFPESASGTFEQCAATNGGERCELPTGHGGEHSADRLDWEDAEEDSATGCDPEDCDICNPEVPRKERTAVDRDAAKEREELVLRFALSCAANEAFIGCDLSLIERIHDAASMADAYLQWRAESREKENAKWKR